MLRRYIYATLVAVALWGVAVAQGELGRQPVDPPPPLVSHGNQFRIRIEGAKATAVIYNSLEGLSHKYQLGHTLLETDFEWTTDGHLVVIHDWGAAWSKDFVGKTDGDAGSLEEFMQAEMCYGLTQVTIQKLNEWLLAHPNAYIVTDIKAYSDRGLKYIKNLAPEIATERYIPQIKSFEEYEVARSAGYKRIILTLYQLNEQQRKDEAILEFAQNHELYAVTIPLKRAEATGLAMSLKEMGIHVYAHPFGFGGRSYLEVVREYEREMGIGGFYTSSSDPITVSEDELAPWVVGEECSARNP